MKIVDIEAIPVSLPMTQPMKMAGIEIRCAENVLVRLATEDGVIGWGEAASAPTMTGEFVPGIVGAVRYLAPILTGRRIDAIDAAMVSMDRALYGNASAKAAIEIALHDALGKTLRVPVHRLLGGAKRERVAALRMLAHGRIEEDCADAARLQAEGYVAWKIKVGVNDPLYDAERTRRICAILGAGHLLSADANQAWTVEQAIAYLRAVEGCGLDFIEQPVDGADLAGMARVARSTRIAIGADEGLHALDDIRRHHACGAMRGGSLKAIKLGGIARMHAAAGLCEELGLQVNLACKIAESGIATAAVLQVAAAVPSVNWGISLSSQYLAQDIVRTPLVIRRGYATVPSGPGLGIDVDESLVRRYAVEP